MRRIAILLFFGGAIVAVAVVLFLWPPENSTDVAIGTVAEIEASRVVYVQQPSRRLPMGNSSTRAGTWAVPPAATWVSTR
ncbi:MAG: hypothetical protein WD651_04725 [Acidimicrobiia bacterium]